MWSNVQKIIPHLSYQILGQNFKNNERLLKRFTGENVICKRKKNVTDILSGKNNRRHSNIVLKVLRKKLLSQ